MLAGVAGSPVAADRFAPRCERAFTQAAGRPTPLDLESQLAAQARGSPALRRAVARVAGRMVATRGWERLGFARLADYANERAGVSPRELRDLARVDAALEELPGLEAAFVAGVIAWTQLRLLCRVATPEDEARWLAVAARSSARALAREVRAVDQRARGELAASADGDETHIGVVLRVSPRARARWWHARQVACRVAGHALSQAEFAEVLAAETFSAAPPGGAVSGVPVDGRPVGSSLASMRGIAGASPVGARRLHAVAAPPPAEVEALERGLETADAFRLDARLRRGVRCEARTLARVASRLVDVVAWRLYREIGFQGLDRYAEERLGMSARRARALLRVGRVARACPALREAFMSGRLSWVQAHALLPALADEPGGRAHRAAWIEHAQRVSVRRLRDDVEEAVASGAGRAPTLEARGPEGLQTGAISRRRVESARLFFAAPPEVAHLFRAMLATVQRALERARGHPVCPSDALEAMLDHALAAWQPEKRVTRAETVLERDGWRCTAPGCTSYRHLERHHVVFRSRGGSDDDTNLTTLCAWHHRRGVHEGLMRCTGTAPDGLRFELGLRPGAPPLAAFASGDEWSGWWDSNPRR